MSIILEAIHSLEHFHLVTMYSQPKPPVSAILQAQQIYHLVRQDSNSTLSAPTLIIENSFKTIVYFQLCPTLRLTEQTNTTHSDRNRPI